MKCNDCLELLEEYLDGELTEQEAAPFSAHLITCAACAHEFDSLKSEQEIYTRYDRELDIAPSMWSAIAARTTETGKVVNSGSNKGWRAWFVVPSFGWSFAGAMAILIFAVVLGVAYLRQGRGPAKQEMNAGGNNPATAPERQAVPVEKMAAINSTSQKSIVDKNQDRSTYRVKPAVASRLPLPKKPAAPESDVVFSEVAYSAVEEQDTQRHIEQAQNLLRSVRNINVTDDEEIDVSFEKALSRRLLNENVVLRRDAEMSGKFPTKMLLSDLEPFLIDIANLPDKAAPDDLRVIKERVLKTEIVAALLGY